MTRSVIDLPQAYWSDWIDRDDRELVDLLARKFFVFSDLPPQLKSLLEPIVASLAFGSHTQLGVKEASKLLKPEVELFFHYLLKSHFFVKTKRKWRLQVEGPYSLAFLLSRTYLRFQNLRAAQKIQIAPMKSQGNQNPSADFISVFILEAFDAMTDDLPTEGHERLIYQLHLGGLLPDEIGAILALAVSDVSASIAQSKSQLLNIVSDNPGKGWGT